MTEIFFDWLVRNQESIATALAALLAYGLSRLLPLDRVAGRWGERMGRSLRGWLLGTHGTFGDFLSGIVKLGVPGKGKLTSAVPASVLVLLVVLGGAYWFFKWVEPIPRTTALEFPAPACQRAQRDGILVFIHGWNGDAHETWQKFAAIACQDERLQRLDIVSVSYPTFMVKRNLKVPQLASWIHKSIEARLSPGANERILIIAHSMGGLIARELSLARVLAGNGAVVQSMVEIATPHLGAVPARIAESLGISEDQAIDLKADSTLLTSLQERWGIAGKRPRTACFTSPQDQVVAVTSALYQCDTAFTYPQWGHSEMVQPGGAQDDRYLFPIRELLSPRTPGTP